MFRLATLLVFAALLTIAFAWRRHRPSGHGFSARDRKCFAKLRKYGSGMLLTCCGGNIVFKHGHVSHCCGSQSYNPLRQLCCGKKVYYKWQRYTLCCGNKPYTPTANQGCCDKQVINRTLEGCCRNSKYKKGQSTCCEGEIVPNMGYGTDCCGPWTYDAKSYKCCAGFVRPLSAGGQKNTKCCMSDAYDSRTQLCCAFNLVNKTHKDDDKCCFGKTFNSKKQQCCEYDVHDMKKGEEMGCCRNGPFYVRYSKRTHICCRGVMSRKTWGGNTYCCGKKAYNYGRNLCCQNKIARKRRNEDVCCGTFPYNRKSFLCCNGILRHKYNAYYLCCYNRTYDNRYYMCKDGQVRRRGWGTGTA